MKYIHDGQFFVAWFAADGQHSDLARKTKLTPVHAGAVQFHGEREAVVFGHSVTLMLTSEPFDFPQVLYVARPYWAEYPLLSNTDRVFEALGLQPEVARWVQSKEGWTGESAVWYPTAEMAPRYYPEEINRY